MISLRLITIGRAEPSFEAFEESMVKRLKGFVDFEVVELPEGKSRNVLQRKQDEERLIMKTVRSQYVLLDERGQGFGSRHWAEFFGMQHGSAQLDFVIGGAAGVSSLVRDRASQCWKLSDLTMPHKLARILVVEQFYRAFTILTGHPYHRD
ncbi:MAG: 23S rRNA (pseudouridine(1915)-N(3))-methyltransferase RlmH [Zetaproteobacteria bacterium]|nr:23S rRNA (pseudouridine(1915)-N(3))-methyltransferase RlmH [Zetaproteobacteria bacterium]